MPTLRELQASIRSLIEDVVRLQGLDLVAVQVARSGSQTLLRLTLDAPNGVSIEDCARVSRLISPILDAEDPITGAYTLEVSSPGPERPVQKIEDFCRFLNCSMRFRMAPGAARQRYTGRLLAVEGGLVRVEAADGVHELDWEQIERATLLPEEPPPEPKRGRKGHLKEHGHDQ